MRNAAITIVKQLRSAGYEAYFAGGCVRDALLGLAPKDYDIATNATPDTIMRIFRKTVAIGKAFGVISVLSEGFQFDVTTFRSDGNYSDGRRPDSVTFSDRETDVTRRDFTINGLLEDPVAGEIIDLVGGQEDIRRKVIRTIGDPRQRFAEDKLRMMRAVRFSCQLNFAIDPATSTAIKEMSPSITQVSYERIRDEIEKILVSPLRAEGIDMLHSLGILREILPEVADMEGVPQPPDFHPEGDVFTHVKLCLSNLRDPSFEVAMATLLHDIGKPPTITFPADPKTDRIRFNAHEVVGERMTERVCRRFKLSREETEKICWMVAKHMTFKDVEHMRESTLKKFLSHEFYDDLEQVFVADKMAADKDMASFEYLKAMRGKFTAEDLKPEPFLRGKDLIELGLAPGPIFTTILAAVYDSQLEGGVKTRDEAIVFVKEKYLTI